MIIGKNIETLLSAVRDSFNRFVNGKQVVGSQTVDILSASVATLTVPAGATEAMMTIEKTGLVAADANLPVARWSVTSVAPVTGASSASTHGMTISPAQNPLIIRGSEALTNFKIIAIGATTTGNLMLKVTYFK